MRKIISALTVALASCSSDIDTSGLSASCTDDADCHAAVELPCNSGCLRCEGIAVNDEGLEEYNSRLSFANTACFGDPGTCSDCATDTVRRTPKCEQGTCVVTAAE